MPHIADAAGSNSSADAAPEGRSLREALDTMVEIACQEFLAVGGSLQEPAQIIVTITNNRSAVGSSSVGPARWVADRHNA